MNFKHFLISGSILFSALTASAQDSKDKQMEASADKAQEAWMQYMTPGPMHKMLASANGEWKEELTFWMTPGAPATKAEATCTNKMIMGDRYQESLHSGQMMGMPFEGRGILGYDNAKKVFQSTWIDNMGTGVMYMEGTWDEKTKSMTLKGKGLDPSTGKEETMREVYKIVDDNTHMMEMYGTKDGKEYKSMEIKFTRKG